MQQFNSIYSDSFVKAEKLFNKGDFRASFQLFSNVANNIAISNMERSEAFNMMGNILVIFPSIDMEDDTGLKYYLNSIKLNDSNIGALLNIIETFGKSIDSHQDLVAFDFAANKIKQLSHELSNEECKMLDSKIQERNKYR